MKGGFQELGPGGRGKLCLLAFSSSALGLCCMSVLILLEAFGFLHPGDSTVFKRLPAEFHHSCIFTLGAFAHVVFIGHGPLALFLPSLAQPHTPVKSYGHNSFVVSLVLLRV